MRDACSDAGVPEIDVAKIINFDSVRAYRWLIETAEPDQKLYSFLRQHSVDLSHAINLLDGALARCEWSVGGPKEDCVALPVMGENGSTPFNVVVFSMRDPSRFETVLGLGTILGTGELMNPA